jgi:hypothetical protein
LKKDDATEIIKELETKKEWYEKKGTEELESEEPNVYYDKRSGEYKISTRRDDEEGGFESKKESRRGGGGRRGVAYKDDHQEFPELL